MNENNFGDDINDDLVPIDNLANIADQMRKTSIKEFNERYQNEGLAIGKTTMFKNPKRLSKKTLEKIIKITEVIEILQDKLPYDKETEQYSLSISLFWVCVDQITKNIFYNICNRLVDEGIYEMIWDQELYDFAWRLTPEYKEKFGKGIPPETDITEDGE